MASNTSILIKRSQSSSTPSLGLKDGELAYSYASNTLFIGNANTMMGYEVIGGQGLLESLSANLTIGDASSNTANINLQSDTLTFRGTGSISANVVSNMFGESEVQISIDDSTYLKANTGSTFETQVINTNLQVDGDLIVNGTTTTINSTQVSTGETIIVLANNNTTGDSVDTGFVSRYNNGDANVYTGLVRDSSSSGDYALFQSFPEPVGQSFSGVNITSITNGMEGTFATLHANVAAPLVTASKLRTTDSGIQLGYEADAGDTGQMSNLSPKSVAIGYRATANTGSSSTGAIAIGSSAGYGVTSGPNSVAIGTNVTAEGNSGIAIGVNANATGVGSMGMYGSIVLNASAISNITSAQEGFYVNPVREVAPENFDTNDGIAMYNSSTKEMRYTHTLDGGTF
jgi:hypothetical protein